MVDYSAHERLAFGEYLEFLTRTDLGSQYPSDRFQDRIAGLLKSASVCVTARAGRLVGVCLAITDWNYFVFITDLGVDRAFVGQGIGRRLLELAIEQIGDVDELTVVTLSNEEAVGFYRKQGMEPDFHLLVRYCKNWDSVDLTRFVP
ncbi:MAG: GNAT family N-acetyltransferase [Fimbriimonadaceae bacterium]|nr:GNAT family N-acetyltransferase [Fimbriimonadaceae bacterium]